MASRTVNLADDAYELLRAQKREGESFSDVVRRLAGHRSLAELEGLLTPAQAKRVEAAIQEGRRRSRARRVRQERQFRRLFGR